MGRLFWKFFLSILLAQLTVTFGVGSVFWLRDQARLQAAAEAPEVELSPSAEFMIDSAAATLAHGGTPALRALLEGTARHNLFAIDDSGRELLERPVAPELRMQAEHMLANGEHEKSVRLLAAPDGARYLLFQRSLGEHHGPGGPPPPGGFDHGAPADGPHGHPGPRGPTGRHVPYLTMGGAVLASLLFAWLLAMYFSRPIRDLRSAFEAAASGDLAPRFAHLKAGGGDELKDLGRDFDKMSAQLSVLMDGQRRLLHDVSHELRSPLARLQAAIGLAHQQPESIGPSLERIERESVRMDKLVGELLTLSRLEAASALPVSEDIAAMELIDEIVDDARFEAEQCGRQIDLSGLAIVTVRGDPNLLWRAIENVVRNAIKHSPEEGTVRIDVSANAQTLDIVVHDRGPGVAAEHLGAIFQPFFRSNAATNNVNGHGLGLAIAKRVIEAHGGSIVANNREGGGLSVAIALPVKH